MGGYSRDQRAEWAGRWLGTAVRTLIFRSGRLVQMPVGVRVLASAVGIAVLALLFFFALWLAVILVLAWVVLNVMQRVGQPGRFKWEPTDPNDHRQSLFNHPLSYNDDRDPRFPDPRFPDK